MRGQRQDLQRPVAGEAGDRTAVTGQQPGPGSTQERGWFPGGVQG